MLKPAIHTTGVDTKKTARLDTERPPTSWSVISVPAGPKTTMSRRLAAAITPKSVTSTLRFICFSSRSGASYTSAQDWLQKKYVRSPILRFMAVSVSTSIPQAGSLAFGIIGYSPLFVNRLLIVIAYKYICKRHIFSDVHLNVPENP